MAILGERINLVPDVQLFVETLGAKAFQAMTVKVEAARELLGEQDLQAISESTATPVLRVVPLPRKAA